MNPFKKLLNKITPPTRRTLYHPDFANKTEPAIKYAGVQYYRFKDDLDMPYGRYQYLASFIQAVEMRMNLKTLNAYLVKLDSALSGGKGKIDIGDALVTLKQIKTRATISFDSDLAYSLASCIYFTDEEVLDTYEMDLNKAKIARWRELNALDFFMLSPIKELLGFRNISVTDLMTYLIKSEPMLVELRQAIDNPSSNSN